MLQNHKKGLLGVFRLVKALLSLRYDTKPLRWTFMTKQSKAVFGNENIDPTYAGIHGFAGALAKELKSWTFRFFDLPDALYQNFKSEHVRLFSQIPADEQHDVYYYRKKQWYRQQLILTSLPEEAEHHDPFRYGGVYVVIGGAGGIGRAWSEQLIRDHQAKLVWIGRRALDSDIESQIEHLAQFGARPLYINADAGNRADLQRALQRIKSAYRKIDGLVHSAMVLKDRSIMTMDEKDFLEVLASKVDVCVNLAQVFCNEDLDFVLFFSAVNSFLKAPGQSNYAAACTFEDSFGAYLNKRWKCPVKVINWGYWGAVGAVASAKQRRRMREAGIASIEINEAMPIIRHVLADKHAQWAIIKTALKESKNENSWLNTICNEQGLLKMMNQDEQMQKVPQKTDFHFSTLKERLLGYDHHNEIQRLLEQVR